MRVSDIPQRTQSTVISNLQIGQIPKVVFIGFVDSEDFHGSQKKNPFYFQHFNITQISVEVDGQSYPTKPYTADFARNLSLECYDGLLDTLGHRPSLHGGLPFNRTQYNDGYTIFGFDLTPGHTGRGPLTLIKQGNLSVSVSFGKPLKSTIMMTLQHEYTGNYLGPPWKSSDHSGISWGLRQRSSSNDIGTFSGSVCSEYRPSGPRRRTLDCAVPGTNR
ncbi:uncharacterized protein F54H12.2-like [Paramacrobiotus metropolitanus]|nr:uncharacterized protein F54H12.2-like [Paramacrobiotus metropolitanus]